MAKDYLKLGGIGMADLNIDALGIAYLTIACVYTVFLFFLIFLFWRFRDHEAIRIRGFWITVSSVISLQVYVLCILIAYPLTPKLPCSSEFWIMSLFLPFGMGLFQACQVQVLARSEGQMRLIIGMERAKLGSKEYYANPKQIRSLRDATRAFKALNIAKKTYIGVVCGIITTFITTLFLFFGSRRFHEGYGAFGQKADPVQCRHGFEWLPSIFWQFLWSAVFGPYVLWKIRGIHDLRGWAMQTRIAIIANLPGTPLWLMMLYTNNDTIHKMLRYVVPPIFFLPALVTMQQVMLAVPLWSILNPPKPRHRPPPLTIRRRDSQEESLASPSMASISTGRRNRDPYCMAALEAQIEKNIEPLIEWAAMKEFTAENVVFLKEVRDYKRKWATGSKSSPPPLYETPQLAKRRRQQQYMHAARIYFALVDKDTAEFEINIDFRTYQDLASYFTHLTYLPSFQFSQSLANNGQHQDPKNVVTPWDSESPFPPSFPTFPVSSSTSVINKAAPPAVSSVSGSSSPVAGSPTSDTSVPDLEVPEHFSTELFERAFASVKYLVLTNTWVRFIDRSEAASIAGSDWSKDTYITCKEEEIGIQFSSRKISSDKFGR